MKTQNATLAEKEAAFLAWLEENGHVFEEDVINEFNEFLAHVGSPRLLELDPVAYRCMFMDYTGEEVSK